MAFKGDGSTYFSSPFRFPSAAKPFTLLGWYYLPSNNTTGDSVLSLSSLASNADINTSLSIRVSNDLARNWIADDNNGIGSAQTSSPNVITGAWQPMVGVFRSTVSRGIIAPTPGIAEVTNTTSVTSVIYDTVAIGSIVIHGTPSGTLQTGAMIAECALWTCELSRPEIDALLAGANPMTVRPGNLQFYFPLINNPGNYTGAVINMAQVGSAAVVWGNHPPVEPMPALRRHFLAGASAPKTAFSQQAEPRRVPAPLRTPRGLWLPRGYTNQAPPNAAFSQQAEPQRKQTYRPEWPGGVFQAVAPPPALPPFVFSQGPEPVRAATKQPPASNPFSPPGYTDPPPPLAIFSQQAEPIRVPKWLPLLEPLTPPAAFGPSMLLLNPGYQETTVAYNVVAVFNYTPLFANLFFNNGIAGNNDALVSISFAPNGYSIVGGVLTLGLLNFTPQPKQIVLQDVSTGLTQTVFYDVDTIDSNPPTFNPQDLPPHFGRARQQPLSPPGFVRLPSAPSIPFAFGQNPDPCRAPVYRPDTPAAGFLGPPSAPPPPPAFAQQPDPFRLVPPRTPPSTQWLPSGYVNATPPPAAFSQQPDPIRVPPPAVPPASQFSVPAFANPAPPLASFSQQPDPIRTPAPLAPAASQFSIPGTTNPPPIPLPFAQQRDPSRAPAFAGIFANPGQPFVYSPPTSASFAQQPDPQRPPTIRPDGVAAVFYQPPPLALPIFSQQAEPVRAAASARFDSPAGVFAPPVSALAPFNASPDPRRPAPVTPDSVSAVFVPTAPLPVLPFAQQAEPVRVRASVPAAGYWQPLGYTNPSPAPFAFSQQAEPRRVPAPLPPPGCLLVFPDYTSPPPPLAVFSQQAEPQRRAALLPPPASLFNQGAYQNPAPPVVPFVQQAEPARTPPARPSDVSAVFYQPPQIGATFGQNSEPRRRAAATPDSVAAVFYQPPVALPAVFSQQAEPWRRAASVPAASYWLPLAVSNPAPPPAAFSQQAEPRRVAPPAQPPGSLLAFSGYITPPPPLAAFSQQAEPQRRAPPLAPAASLFNQGAYQNPAPARAAFAPAPDLVRGRQPLPASSPDFVATIVRPLLAPVFAQQAEPSSTRSARSARYDQPSFVFLPASAPLSVPLTFSQQSDPRRPAARNLEQTPSAFAPAAFRPPVFQAQAGPQRPAQRLPTTDASLWLSAPPTGPTPFAFGAQAEPTRVPAIRPLFSGFVGLSGSAKALTCAQTATSVQTASLSRIRVQPIACAIGIASSMLATLGNVHGTSAGRVLPVPPVMRTLAIPSYVRALAIPLYVRMQAIPPYVRTQFIPAATRILYVPEEDDAMSGSSAALLQYDPMDPTDVDFFTADWSSRTVADPIVSATVTAIPPLLTLGSPSYTATRVQVQVSNGPSVEETVGLRFAVTLTSGRVMHWTFDIPVQNL